MTYHKWEFKCLYTDTAGKTSELLECLHCRQGKLGQERPGERGVMGPYSVDNGRDTCPTLEELEARRVSLEAFTTEQQNARDVAAAQRCEEVRLRAEASGVTPRELPFNREEARAIYDAGYSSGSERGADGGSFEAALREIGR